MTQRSESPSPPLRDGGGDHGSAHAAHGHGEARPTVGPSSLLFQEGKILADIVIINTI